MDNSLGVQLEAACNRYGDAIALQNEDVVRSYSELLRGARKLSTELLQSGVQANETVMLRVSSHPDDTIAFLAVWLCGAVVVPVHRTAPAAAVDAVQSTAACRVSVDRSADGKFEIESLAQTIRPQREILRGAALVIFTSGSTGQPKGVVLKHSGLSGKLRENQKLLEFDVNDVVLMLLSNTFSYAIWMTLITLLHGGTVVLRHRFQATDFLRALVDFGVTRVGVVPTMARSLFSSLSAVELKIGEDALRTLGALRDVITGGESLGVDLSVRLRSFFAPARVYDIYGLTETSTCDFVLSPEQYVAHPDSIGLPAAHIHFRVMQGDGSSAPVGQPGELQLKTPFIMGGYLDADVQTKEAFMDEWFRTGDLAVVDADGFVSIVGRLKEVIVRGGNKITPLEVERALLEFPAVAAAAVTGLPDAVLGQRIHAVLIPRLGSTVDPVALKAFLNVRLERFKHPDCCYLTIELPTGRTGKLDRGGLAREISTGAAVPLEGWAGARI